MTHQNVDQHSDRTQRQTSPTSRPTSHNASSGPAQNTLIDVTDTREATSHKATFRSPRPKPSCAERGFDAGTADRTLASGSRAIPYVGTRPCNRRSARSQPQRDERGRERALVAGVVRKWSRTTAALAPTSWPLCSGTGSPGRLSIQRRFRPVLAALRTPIRSLNRKASPSVRNRSSGRRVRDWRARRPLPPSGGTREL